MIWLWILVIVFPIVFAIQLASQRNAARKQKERMTGRHFLKALIHTILLTLIAYAAYIIGILVNA